MANDKTHFNISLFDEGVEGAGFRVQNEPGELQRAHVDQYRTSDVSYQADLVAVMHGTMTPGGRRGVLVVVDFHFVSKPQGRRFKTVEISLAFGREDRPIGSTKEPVVEQMAPRGAFGMDEATQNRVDAADAHASVNAGGASLATLGIGGSFQRTTTTDTKSYAVLNGMPWIQVRSSGGWNSARWTIRENEALRKGVPPHLRGAVLLSLPDEARFRAELSLTANIGTFHAKVRRTVAAKTKMDPVYFDPSDGNRTDMGGPLSDVDKTELGACKLASIGSAKLATITP